MDHQSWTERQNEKAETMERNLGSRFKRSPEDQIAILDERLGKNIGARKERARLLAQIEARTSDSNRNEATEQTTNATE